MDLSRGVQPYTNVVASEQVDLSSSIQLSDLKSRTVVITGGASGIGAELSQRLSQQGANIIIGDRNVSAGEHLIARLRQSTKNDNHHFLTLDVTSWPSQLGFFKSAAQLSPHRGIDSVIAGAGISGSDETTKFENPQDYSMLDPSSPPPPPGLSVLDINLTGVLYTTHLALSYLSHNPGSVKCSPAANDHKPRDRHLLLVSSVAGLAGLPTNTLYTASKHAVVGLFRSLRITAPITHGVRVNMLNPYFIDTPILGPLGALVLAGGAMAKLEDVADAAVRLIGDKSIVGRALMIAGRGGAEQAQAAGMVVDANSDPNMAVWDVYAHDFQQSDLFTRRIVALTNLVTSARGWAGFWIDVCGYVSRSARRLIGC